jgi:hypothetical protein
MASGPDFVSRLLSRSRAVVIHSRGQRKLFGQPPDESGLEVMVEDLEALASAGFDIVEFNMADGKPLCAALMAVAIKAPAMYRNQTRPATFQTRPQWESSGTRIRLGLDLRLD